MATDDSAELRARLETLPQELYDQIYDFTFTAEPCVPYLDRLNLCPLVLPCEAPKLGRPLLQKSNRVKLLHVDRTSRHKFAQSFYGGEGAAFVAERRLFDLLETICFWLRSLPLDHQAMILDVRAIASSPPVLHTVPGFVDEKYPLEWNLEYMSSRILREFGTQVSQATTFGVEDKLPQELFDRIYDFTFTAEPGVRYLDRFNPYHHPMYIPRPLFQKLDSINLLHVDRASRKQFAESFYGGDGAVFVMTGHAQRPAWWIKPACIEWLSILPSQHRALIKDVRCAIKGHSRRHSGRTQVTTNSIPANVIAGMEMMVLIEHISEVFGDKVVQVLSFGYEDEIISGLPGYRAQVCLLGEAN
ncbi:hypothetical protein M409DRAFT_23820 [Zasmidium cellare ATCC 36951]|uniref:Uncharacterized protein n=1 Tax=Zasmidium cellare ATCC 36951 TaxID=1080233 RepID=A0A6A6CHG6_ZASCE|nr:uncharacterized protein M409DRAFT_23820 [Zasmidium cellare ATCC 36951]KAF2166093.1 hypothetical protein M409DRAFT_23820 [Zasmidium cellare ATCC 36951]